MVFSYQALSRLVDLSSLSPEELSSRLTFSGFEVEGRSPFARADHLVIGHILSCEKHPDSDHLHLLEVDCGPFGIRKIVCGAPNARKGLKVIVALPGANLPAIGKVIQAGSIRGYESDGMCCSLTELGIDASLLSEKQAEGIEELPEDAPVGSSDVLNYLGLEDTLLDVNVLPNRPDCLSYLGLAREISSLTGRALQPVPSSYPRGERTLDGKSETKACPRFTLLSLSGLKPKASSPLWAVRLLQASGIRPISPLVDLGNVAMLLTGEPFNLYDGGKNPDGIYRVRDDYEGPFVAFDGQELALKKGDLVIEDGKGRPLCLAGIETGKDVAVSEETTSLVVEAAVFYHASIRHTSARLGLSSFSSRLFAKERNPRMIDEALSVFVSLLPQFLDAYCIDGSSDEYPEPKENPWFAFSVEKLNHRLGSSYTAEECENVLKAYRIESDGKGNVRGPKDRVDLLEQCDIDEEVFRYYGAERIPLSMDGFPVTRGGLSPEQEEKRELSAFLRGRGLDEVLTYTLIDEKADSSIRVFSKDPGYHVLNPMTKDHEIVRSDLLPSLLSVIRYNLNHGKENLALFEISPVDTPKGNRLYLSFAFVGAQARQGNYLARPYSFFDAKGLVEAVLTKLGISLSRVRSSYSKNPAFHPWASADLTSGKTFLGTYGALSPTLEEGEPIVGELDLGALLALPGRRNAKFVLASGSEIRRDLSFAQKDGVSFGDIERTLSKASEPLYRRAELFDLFEERETGKKYIGISLYLAAEDGRTLKNPEIEEAVGKLSLALTSKLGLLPRGE